MKTKLVLLIEQLHLKRVIQLSTATALGQLITFLASPVLTRLYSAEEFSQYAVFYSLALTLSVIATFRLEYALPKSESPQIASKIAGYAIDVVWKATTVIAIAVAITYFAFGSISFYFAIVPVGVVLIAIPQVYNFLSTRLELYRLNSAFKLINAILVNGLSILFGWMWMGPIGLGLGFLIGQLLSYVVLRFGVKKHAQVVPTDIFKSGEWPQHRSHAWFNSTQGIIETLQLSGITWLLNVLFQDSDAGLYFMCWKIIQMPVNLISNTVFQVQFNKAADLRNDRQSYYTLIRKTSWLLFMGSAVMAIVLVVFGPDLFALFFGEAWREAGVFARYLAPFFIFYFSVSPFSFVPIIERKQKEALLLSVIDILGKLMSIYVGYLFQSVHVGFLLYSAVGSLMLFITYLWYLRLSK